MKKDNQELIKDTGCYYLLHILVNSGKYHENVPENTKKSIIELTSNDEDKLVSNSHH